jgi:DNA-binding GntR family transcriptional regulator
MKRIKRQSTPTKAEDFSLAVKRTAIPDQAVRFLRQMILSGKWRPGDRIVETRVARQLGIGQPTIREALGKLEEAGLIARSPNCGCTVTKLTEKEYGEVFQVRVELESLAVELAAASKNTAGKKTLARSLSNLKKAAIAGNVEQFYRLDLEFHQLLWELTANRFLERALSQMVVPLFAFVMIEFLEGGKLDMRANVQEHEKLMDAILTSDRTRARKLARQVLQGFWIEGIGLLKEKRTK